MPKPGTSSGFSSAFRAEVLAFASVVPVSLALDPSPYGVLLSCRQPGALERRGFLFPCLLSTCCVALDKLLYLSVLLFPQL